MLDSLKYKRVADVSARVTKYIISSVKAWSSVEWIVGFEYEERHLFGHGNMAVERVAEYIILGWITNITYWIKTLPF